MIKLDCFSLERNREARFSLIVNFLYFDFRVRFLIVSFGTVQRKPKMPLSEGKCVKLFIMHCHNNNNYCYFHLQGEILV